MKRPLRQGNRGEMETVKAANIPPVIPVVIAMDGGQSSTMCIVTTPHGDVLGSGAAGPADHINEPGGPERCRQAVTTALQAALADADLDPRRVHLLAAGFGMSGGGARMQEIIRDCIAAEHVVVIPDSVASWQGATGGDPGVIVISGTGSVAYGRSQQGDEHWAGGWGYLMGDEGSGYWIGIRALSAATRSHDGVGATTTLEERVPNAFGLPDLQAVHTALYSDKLGRVQIARLGRVVDEAAAAGDTVARAILECAAEHLANLAQVVFNSLGLQVGQHRVSYVGGVFRSSILLDRFCSLLSHSLGPNMVQKPRFPAIVGAWQVAAQAAGLPATPSECDRITATLSPKGDLKE